MAVRWRGWACLLYAGLNAAAVHAEDFAWQPSGFVNGTIGVDDGGRGAAVGDAEFEITPQIKTPNLTLALRAALAGSASGRSSGPDTLVLAEVSVFAIGPFGRIEVGHRAGFPQSLVGFTPSEIAFTMSEYGPESGRRLDPDGRLPTALLPAAARRSIDRLSYLGYAARLYDDRSAKIIYLTPRFRSGFYGALSFTPRPDRPDAARLAGPARQRDERFRDIVQAALVWTNRTEAVDLSIGGTGTVARAIGDRAGLELPDRSRGKTTSVSGGVSAIFHDAWALGASATWTRTPASTLQGHQAFGAVASLNYVNGPLTLGGYVQHADAPARQRGRERLDVAQAGISWLVDHDHDLLGAGRYTDAKLFAAVTGYRRAQSGDVRRYLVAMAGVRASFF